VPVVTSIAPLWQHDDLPVMTGLGLDRREVLVTSVIDAVPEYRHESVGPSLWPLVAALATSAMFVASIFTPWAVVWGSLPIGVALVLWFWPRRPRATTAPEVGL
jgi:cytochrome c oxidase subunit 1